MNKILWTDEFATGYEEIDKCNQNLFDCLNRFSILIESEEIYENLYGIISELEEHCDFFLKIHESIMKGYNSELYAEHIKDHQIFRVFVKRCSEEFFRDKNDLVETMHIFLWQWINYHVLTKDQKLKDLLIKNKKETKNEIGIEVIYI